MGVPVATSPEKSHPLQPVLEDVELELRRRLQEACEAEARGVRTDSTSEIRRLEDSLLAAAVAAEQTVTLRRHMREHPDAENVAEALTPDTASQADSSEAVTTLREFRDRTGTAWRAWAVTPGLARSPRSTEQFLGPFHQGWVCFEALDKSGRRRLPCHRSRLSSAKDEELERMLEEAISAPERKSERKADQEGEAAGSTTPSRLAP